eukprot:Hpha_TRINITY_DN13235_c0_g2::TRINITY_DN13235_c0_g2_i1::g.154755::m.154755
MDGETPEQAVARLRQEEAHRLAELEKVVRLQSRLEENLAEESCLARCSEIAHRTGGVGQLAGEQHATLRSVRGLACSVAALEVRCAHLAYPFTLGHVGGDWDPTEFCLFRPLPADLAPLVLGFADLSTLWRARHVSRCWYAAVQHNTAGRFEELAEEKPQGPHPDVSVQRSRAEAPSRDRVELEKSVADLSDQIRNRRSQLVPQLLQLRTLRNQAAAQNALVEKDRLRDLRGDLVRQVSEAEAQHRRLKERERALEEHVTEVLGTLGITRRPWEPEKQKLLAPRQGRELVPPPARGLVTPMTLSVPLGKVIGGRKRAISQIVDQVVTLDSRFARTLAHALMAAAELKDRTIPSPQRRHSALPPLVPAPPEGGQLAAGGQDRAPRPQLPPAPPPRRVGNVAPRPPP